MQRTDRMQIYHAQSAEQLPSEAILAPHIQGLVAKMALVP